HSWAELNALIKEKSAAGWQFNFLGTGIDAYDTGARMGVAAMHTLSSGLTGEHVRASYAAVADSCLAYARGDASSTEFSMAAREASGDAFYKQAGLGTKAKAAPQKNAPQKNASQQAAQQPSVPPAAPPPAKPRPPIVDDFTL